MNMPLYKQCKIKLTPRRCYDGTWRCPYRIIHFRATRYGYHTGCPHGVFASCESAEIVALDEAKRIVDAFDLPAQGPRSKSDTLLETYGNKVRKLFTRFLDS